LQPSHQQQWQTIMTGTAIAIGTEGTESITTRCDLTSIGKTKIGNTIKIIGRTTIMLDLTDIRHGWADTDLEGRSRSNEVNTIVFRSMIIQPSLIY